jgi:type VI secretion system protein VasD
MMQTKKNKDFYMSKIWQNTILFVFTIALFSCGSTPPQEQKIAFTYAISASDSINPDINNQPSSVVVRIYQLNSPLNFENALYEELFEPRKNALGTEYIAVNEYLVDPGMSQSFEVELSATAKFIGVAVGYRSVDMVTWRVIQTVQEKNVFDPIGIFSRGGIQVLVDELSVRVVEL